MADPTNRIDYLHDESYGHAFDTRDLTHAGMLFMGGRGTEPMADGWRFGIDPFDTGLRQHWYRLPDLRPGDRTEPWDFDLDGGRPVVLPSCWNMMDPVLRHYEGPAWYSRRFRHAPTHAGERVMLRVGAANYDAKVFLNGRFLGSHRGGSTPFFVELTKALESTNNLMIRVDNTRASDRVPMHHFDWFNYGGIHRDVALIRLPGHFIRDLTVYAIPGTALRQIGCRIEVSDTDSDEPARFRIPELAIDVEIPLIAGIGQVVVPAAPDPWAPGTPRLYEISAEWGGDRVDDRVGFRDVAVVDGALRLNGKPLFLRGICVHEDDHATGRVCTTADIARRFDHAVELNCNFLRLAHYPHDERVARMADERGLMLWEEIPVYWAIALDQPGTRADAENQLLELIRRDRNRASVIVWSIGNETEDTDARLEAMRGLAAAARSADPTRLVSAACLVNKQTRRIEDRLAPALDIVGINEYYGWYDRDPDDLKAIAEQHGGGRPLIVTEMGAGAIAGRRGGEHTLFTEAHQARFYRRQIEVLRTLPQFCGMTPWVLYDFHSERRQNALQAGFNRKGLIAEDKTTKKQAFAVLKAFYGELAEAER